MVSLFPRCSTGESPDQSPDSGFALAGACREPQRPKNHLEFSPSSRQQPFNTLPTPLRDSEENFRADIAPPLLIAGELALADPKLAGELLLVRIETAELSQTSADRLPINFGRHGIFLLQFYMPVCINYAS